MLKKILLGLLVVVAAILLFATTRPDTFHVERSATIAAPPEAIFARVAKFAEWDAWSPWARLDPGMTQSFGGTDGTVGATYDWSGNSKVGKGRMTLAAIEPPSRVAIKLEFLEPFASTSDATFTFAPQGVGTRVTWAMDGPMNYLSKVICLFVSMDKMIGGDFEKGLGSLKTLSEGATPATTS
jgi:uncharacterized protein YndB with AHSA1/START domain